MKKIIHLSDLHVGYKGLGTKFGDIVTRIIFNKTTAENYVVVITGDLVEDATREGSYEEVSVHTNRLKAAGFTVLMAPGNHDYGTGSIGNSRYIRQFKKHFFGTTTIAYPKLDIVEQIAFIGLDSMAEEVNWHDALFAQGELGKKQLKRLGEILESNSVKTCEYRVVYLHHHPLHPKPFHQLKDAPDLKETLKGHPIDALLFGHNHDGRVWSGSSAWEIKRIYDAGTSTGKLGMPNPHRVMDLSNDPIFDYDAQF